ncbi:hypothetical protein AVEN_81288-1 [Araneus ventricosus]|uniref:Uncharacterized protein n=1 Tax=Araneus ventricosus TaxID=182803 RepID=A0A4Y2B9A8_ARAVE|nr:hypothetical protein AVEN_81288-1 [Araneus ventricosus]
MLWSILYAFPPFFDLSICSNPVEGFSSGGKMREKPGVIIDNKLNWADHLINMKTKLTHIQQKFTRIAGTNWGLNEDLRRVRSSLNKTVVELMILHVAAALAYPLSARQSRL